MLTLRAAVDTNGKHRMGQAPRCWLRQSSQVEFETEPEVRETHAERGKACWEERRGEQSADWSRDGTGCGKRRVGASHAASCKAAEVHSSLHVRTWTPARPAPQLLTQLAATHA